MKLKELKARLATAWCVLRSEDGNLVAHTKRELKALGYFDGDEMNEAMANDLLALIRVFSSQGHSGFSASFCRSLFNKAAAFEPLGPLSGDDGEWNDVSEMSGKMLYQNNRCGRVFKEGDQVYDMDGVVFEEPNGSRFTSIYSRAPVKFPYTPKTVFAKVPEGATADQLAASAQEALAAE